MTCFLWTFGVSARKSVILAQYRYLVQCWVLFDSQSKEKARGHYLYCRKCSSVLPVQQWWYSYSTTRRRLTSWRCQLAQADPFMFIFSWILMWRKPVECAFLGSDVIRKKNLEYKSLKSHTLVIPNDPIGYSYRAKSGQERRKWQLQ